MGVRDLEIPRVVATGTASIATVTTTNIDFGTPDDKKLAPAPGAVYAGGTDRLVLVLTMSTSGTTDSTSVSVQDAPDSAGSIGTPATATTNGTLTGGTGNQYIVCTIRVKSDRPWIRVRVTRGSGTTDTHVVRAVLLAVGPS